MTSIWQSVPEGKARHLDRFRADWEKARTYSVSNGSRSDVLSGIRDAAWQEFERIGFPVHRRGNELWKYTDLRPVDRQEFAFGLPSAGVSAPELSLLAPRSDSWINLTFVDGSFSPGLSDGLDDRPGVTVSSLDVAHSSTQPSVVQELGSIADFSDDAFMALNTAFMADGLLVSIAPDSHIETPISVVFITTDHSETSRAVFPRIFVDTGEGSEASLIESHVKWGAQEFLTSVDGRGTVDVDDVRELRSRLGQGATNYLTAPVVELSLGVDSSLNHMRVQLDEEDAFHFSSTIVRQARGSNYTSAAFAVGPEIGRNYVHTILDGEDAESTLHGLYITTNRQHQVHEISTSHNEPHGTSRQYYKGILAGRSQAVFSGKITVARGAQKTDAEQKDLNLLLSHGAEVDTKPSLEIYADDVKCAHGATAGHINEDTLFYLQSRGIDYETAQAMLIRGFAAEILDGFGDADLRDFLDRKLDQLMPELQASSDTIGTA